VVQVAVDHARGRTRVAPVEVPVAVGVEVGEVGGAHLGGAQRLAREGEEAAAALPRDGLEDPVLRLGVDHLDLDLGHLDRGDFGTFAITPSSARRRTNGRKTSLDCALIRIRR
jgi:hypothetical protein